MPNKAFTSISLGSEMKEWFKERCKINNWTYDQGMENYKAITEELELVQSFDKAITEELEKKGIA